MTRNETKQHITSFFCGFLCRCLEVSLVLWSVVFCRILSVIFVCTNNIVFSSTHSKHANMQTLLLYENYNLFGALIKNERKTKQANLGVRRRKIILFHCIASLSVCFYAIRFYSSHTKYLWQFSIELFIDVISIFQIPRRRCRHTNASTKVLWRWSTGTPLEHCIGARCSANHRHSFNHLNNLTAI